MEITLSNLGTKDLATLAQRTIAASQTGKYQVVQEHPLLHKLAARYADYDAVYTKLTSAVRELRWPKPMRNGTAILQA